MDYKTERGTLDDWLNSFFSYVLESHGDAAWEIKRHEWELPPLAQEAHADIVRAGNGESCTSAAVAGFIEAYLEVERLKRFYNQSLFWYSLHWQELSESELTPQRRADFAELFENFVLMDAENAPAWRSRRLWQESGFTVDQLLDALSYDPDESDDDQKGAEYAEAANRA